SSGNNADGGTFELLLDDAVVNSHAFGGISVNQTLRSTLSYSGTVAAGSHKIAIDMRRGYGIGDGNTPYQYLDNVTLSGSAVPEPATTLLALAAIGVLGTGRTHRRRF